jgi:thiocyanate hydrolase subunit beta
MRRSASPATIADVMSEQAPTPDEVDHAQFRALMKTPHDVGGELDVPVRYELKQYEQWEENTYVTCECLGWRGIWVSEERRRIQNVDVGHTLYFGLPYYGRWLLAAARVLVEKHHITLGELIERVDEVSRRYAGDGPRPLDAQPRTEGDQSAVARNHHHKAAVGIGDPQCFSGQAPPPSFAVGDAVRVRTLPTIFYTRTQEFTRGAEGEIAKVSYESPCAEEEAWGRDDAKAEWFYIVRFKMSALWDDYSGLPHDTLQTEVPERWLEAVA